MTGPSFDDIFAVMSAASIGDTTARVSVPAAPRPDDTATTFAIALNVLLDDLASRVAVARQELEAARAAGAALREAEGRFARLSESGIIGILVSDIEGRVFQVNDAVLRIVGYPRDEILSGRVEWKGLTPPEWRDNDVLAVEQLRTAGAARLREKEYLRRDGTRVPVLAGSAMLEHARGASDQVISFVLDLTERNEARMAVEQMRRESAERRTAEQERALLASIVDASDEAIIGKTLQGVVTSWNHGAKRLFGYEGDEIVGKSISLLVPPGRESEEQAILNGVARGETQRFDTVRRRRDGTDVDVSVTSSPIRDAMGAVVGVAKVAREITARKRAEVALAKAKEVAEGASRELEAFSYSVAHDLRAPLRGMNGFAQVLLNRYKDKLDAEGQDWLNEIVLNAKKMAGLIDALLSLARVTRSDLKIERVDLSGLVREASDVLRASEPDRTIGIDVQEGLFADLDVGLARALVLNLVGNAWKFTGKTPAGRIEFGSIEEKGSRVFFVRDNGAGFDMAFASKLFAPFQRLHSASEFPGTGIGLATVQRIVRRHGGHVWAEGVPGAGATFYFTVAVRGSGGTP